MSMDVDIKRLDHLIQEMKRIAGELETRGQEIPAVAKNTKRIMASVKMLEINISDVCGI